MPTWCNATCVVLMLAAAQSAPPTLDHLRPAETVAAAHLTAEEKRAIVVQLDETSFDTPDSWDTEALVRRVRLGDSDGLVVQGSKLLCGATGNCEIWVFRRTKDGWHNLFGGGAPLASAFGFDAAQTSGVPNLVLETHMSADVTRRTVFTFNGGVYQPRDCVDVTRSGSLTKTPCTNELARANFSLAKKEDDPSTGSLDRTYPSYRSYLSYDRCYYSPAYRPPPSAERDCPTC